MCVVTRGSWNKITNIQGHGPAIPPLNKPHITLLITPLKISLILLFEAIPE